MRQGSCVLDKQKNDTLFCCFLGVFRCLHKSTVHVESLIYSLASTSVYWVSANGFFSHLTRHQVQPLPPLTQLIIDSELCEGARIGYRLFFGFCVFGSIAMLVSTIKSSYRKIAEQLLEQGGCHYRLESQEVAACPFSHCLSRVSLYFSAFYKTTISLSSFFALVSGLTDSFAASLISSSLVFFGVFMAQVINLSKDNASQRLISSCASWYVSGFLSLGYALSQGALYFNQLDQYIMRQGCALDAISDQALQVSWCFSVLILHCLWLASFVLKTVLDYWHRIDGFLREESGVSDYHQLGCHANAVVSRDPVSAAGQLHPEGKAHSPSELGPRSSLLSPGYRSCCKISLVSNQMCCNIEATRSSVVAASYKCFIASMSTFPVIYYDLMIKLRDKASISRSQCFPEVAPIQFGLLQCVALFVMLASYRAILTQFKPQLGMSFPREGGRCRVV